MSALAALLLRMGKVVGGCDRCESSFTRKLVGMGIPVTIGDAADDMLGYEAVVYTDAVGDNDKSVALARKNKISLVPRGQFLAMLSQCFNGVIAVAGAHGKSTCTAMLAHIFKVANRPFSCHIGAEDRQFSNAWMGGKSIFITEACEYKRNLLWLRPGIGIVLFHLCKSDLSQIAWKGVLHKKRVSVDLPDALSCASHRFYFDLQQIIFLQAQTSVLRRFDSNRRL